MENEENVVKEPEDQTPSEEESATPQEDPSPESDRDEKGVSWYNRYREVDRKLVAEARKREALETKFNNFLQAQQAPQPTPQQTPQYTEEQLAATYQADPAKYGFATMKHFFKQEIEKEKEGWKQEKAYEDEQRNAAARALQSFPDLNDEGSEFRAKVEQRLEQANNRYTALGREAPPDILWATCLEVAHESQGKAPADGDTSWDEVSRARAANRGTTPLPEDGTATSKGEEDVFIPPRSLQLAKLTGREKQVREYWKNNQDKAEKLRSKYYGGSK